MTVADYLAWAAAQAEGPRTELINGQIIPMSPERVAHNRTKIRVLEALQRALKAAAIQGEVFTDGLTVPIDQHTAYEPDALVRCGDALASSEMQVVDPLIIVEVISPTSAHSDTSAKLIGYFRLPSVRHYLVVDPDLGSVAHYRRAPDGTVAVNTLTRGILHLDPPGLTVDIGAMFG